jgi:hypothetical protein
MLRAVEAQLGDPMAEDSGVLPSSQMRRVMQPTGEQEFLWLQPRLLDPGLPDDVANRHLVAMANVPELQSNEVASA